MVQVNSSEQNNSKKIIWVLESAPHPVVLHMQLWKIKKLINDGKKVDVVVCGTNVGACMINPLAIKIVCINCQKIVKKSFKNINAELIYVDSLNSKDLHYEYLRKKKNSQKQKIWQVDSVFISKFRQRPEDSKSIFLKRSYEKLESAYHNLFGALTKIIDKENYSEVWTFNERGINSGAAIEVAKEKFISYAALELSGRDYKVGVAYNQTSYDPEFWRVEYFKTIATINRTKVKEGEEFFKNKLNGHWTNAPAFVKPKKIAEDLSNLKCIDVLFLFSSEDEFAALGEDWKMFYESQEDVCRQIKENFPNLNLSVRYHPNQRDIPKKILQNKLKILDQVGIDYYEPNSKYSSYDLIKISKIIVTFGSTIGLEAVFQGGKVIQVDKSWYSGLKVICQANSYSELVDYLKNPDKISIKKYRALSVGYFLMNFTTEECDQAYVTDFLIKPSNNLSNLLHKFIFLLELIISGRPIYYKIKTKLTRTFL
jgi:hypothetical protein